MKRQDFTFDETKLNLTFDRQGNAVWSFKAVKEGIRCEKIPIRFLSRGQRKFNKEKFRSDRKRHSSVIPLISNSLMTGRVKKALINVLERPHFVKRYQIQNHNIVRDFARKGLMDNHFNRKVVELAEIFGFKPRDFNLHHKMPICWGGKNYAENITLIQWRLHARLHQLTTDALAAFFEENEPNKIAKAHYVMIPVLPPVLTKKNIADYFNGFDDLLTGQKRLETPKSFSPHLAPDNTAAKTKKDEKLPQRIPLKEILSQNQADKRPETKTAPAENFLTKGASGQRADSNAFLEKSLVVKRERRLGTKGPWELVNERKAR